MGPSDALKLGLGGPGGMDTRCRAVPGPGLLTLGLVLASPAWLSAHEGGSAAGLLSGLIHPISGFDHVLAMVAVGIWGAQLGQPAIWALPVTFPMVMALGGMLGLLGLPLPGVEVGIGLSALLLGLVVAFERRPGLAVAGALVAFFAIFHGHAHGAELPDGQNGLLYSIGFVVATGTLHATGIGVGLIHKWGIRTTRAAGRRHRHRAGRRLVHLVGSDGLVGMTSPSFVVAHLVTTGLGPLFDGIGHVVVTPEDLLPVVALGPTGWAWGQAVRALSAVHGGGRVVGGRAARPGAWLECPPGGNRTVVPDPGWPRGSRPPDEQGDRCGVGARPPARADERSRDGDIGSWRNGPAGSCGLSVRARVFGDRDRSQSRAPVDPHRGAGWPAPGSSPSACSTSGGLWAGRDPAGSTRNTGPCPLCRTKVQFPSPHSAR